MFDDGLGAAPSPSEVDALEGQLASLTGLANVATGRIVALVAQALETGVWEQAGIRSPEHWLAWKTGMALRRARRLVTIARRHEDCRAPSAPCRRGRCPRTRPSTSVCTSRPSTRQRSPPSLARHGQPGAHRRPAVPLHAGARRARRTAPPTDASPQEVANRNVVAFGFGDDGRWWCCADLDADLGALVQTSLEACRDAEFHDRHADADPNGPTTGVTWGDALVRLGDAALGGLTGDRPASDRHQVILHVRADQPDAPSHLHLGPALPAGVRRHLSCDSTVRWLLGDAAGVPLALGRRQRAFSAQQRTIVEERHGGECARPGCQRRRGLHLHHHVHWEDGGSTDVDNALPLCGPDHRLHHQGLLHITGDPARPETLVFSDHHGRVLTRGAEPRPPDPKASLDEAARHLQVPHARWRHPSGERLDPWSIELGDPPAA